MKDPGHPIPYKSKEGEPILAVACLASSKEALIEYLRERCAINGVAKLEDHFNGAEGRGALLTLASGCGQTIAYNTIEDIPDKDVPCQCGKKHCWMLLYRADMATGS